MIHNIKTDIELSSFYVIFDGSTMVERKGCGEEGISKQKK